MYRFLKCFVMVVMVFISTLDLTAKEKIFAGYFDILVNSAEGTEVTDEYIWKEIRMYLSGLFLRNIILRLSDRMRGIFSVWIHDMTCPTG